MADEPHADAAPFVGLEVATVSADALRAGVRVTGELLATTAPLLNSVLGTHLSAGRRYLRVDLSAAVVGDAGVVDALVEAHTAVSELGGMLIFENAGPQVMEAVRAVSLYVRSADE
ncbi:hypothetical protein GCM10027265_34150 [Jatrophihabitans fulvus]